tara:strand:- start:405 stop:593 length:189 start_codon:yes stop_codon:yes gene_type:complete
MKYSVSMVSPQGRAKTVIIEATDCKDAASKAEIEYPDYDIGRVSADNQSLEYFSKMKEFKKR